MRSGQALASTKFGTTRRPYALAMWKEGQPEAIMTRDDENKRQMSGRRDGQDDTPRPYSSRDLDKVPRPTDEDPAYRSWWVL
jgi:hypothetical protein